MEVKNLPHIVLKIAGKKWKFRFDMKAIWDFQKATGLELKQLSFLEPMIDRDVGVAIKLIWAGLYRFDESLTPEIVAGMIEFHELEEISNIVMESVSEALGIEAEKEKNGKRVDPTKKKKEKSSTGSLPEKQPSA